jgi:hypothetical protein
VPDTPAAGDLRHPELMAIYCNDHLAASTGGIELVGRMLGALEGTAYEPPLRQLLSELREEKAALRSMMATLGMPVRQYKVWGTWVAEKITRAKPNGRLVSRSPLSTLVEFEFLASGVRAKRSGFETLRIAAEVEPRLPKEELDRLVDQANNQYAWLTRTRREVAAATFGGEPGVADRTPEA